MRSVQGHLNFDASYTEKARLSRCKWRGSHMIRELKATYADGVFKPVTPVDLDDGARVVISVTEDSRSGNKFQGLEASAGGGKTSSIASNSSRTFMNAARLSHAADRYRLFCEIPRRY